jgi:hypothetical protein
MLAMMPMCGRVRQQHAESEIAVVCPSTCDREALSPEPHVRTRWLSPILTISDTYDVVRDSNPVNSSRSGGLGNRPAWDSGSQWSGRPFDENWRVVV